MYILFLAKLLDSSRIIMFSLDIFLNDLYKVLLPLEYATPISQDWQRKKFEKLGGSERYHWRRDLIESRLWATMKNIAYFESMPSRIADLLKGKDVLTKF